MRRYAVAQEMRHRTVPLCGARSCAAALESPHDVDGRRDGLLVITRHEIFGTIEPLARLECISDDPSSMRERVGGVLRRPALTGGAACQPSCPRQLPLD